MLGVPHVDRACSTETKEMEAERRRAQEVVEHEGN
jgi:hypothetical protein